MANARTSKSKASKVVDALASIMDACAALPTSAAIADALGVSGKTVRGRVRAGTLRTPDGNALPGVHVSRDGQTALTEAHKRAIAYTFAPADDDARTALASKLASK